MALKSFCVLALGVLLALPIIFACNEAICASVVSKCMLTQSCKCDLKDCSCCKDCFNCLSYLYSECCSCVDMCPKPNDTQNALSKTSYVEELADGIPGLFKALTSDPDPQERWLSITYPVDIDISAYRPASDKQLVYHLQSIEQESEPVSRDVVTFNCTIAYMSQCMSSDKCRASCLSMGANSLRWFHDGCCECVGDKCLSYGLNESSGRISCLRGAARTEREPRPRAPHRVLLITGYREAPPPPRTKAPNYEAHTGPATRRVAAQPKQ